MKLRKIIIHLFLAFLILGCSSKAASINLENKNNDNTYGYIISVDIEASKEKVWNIITDFKNYPKWNSVLKMENNNNLELKKNFFITIFDEKGSIEDNFKALLIDKKKYTYFIASQTLLSSYFFKATHQFLIEEISHNKVRYTQKWKLEGVVGYLFEDMIFDVLKLFKTMNLELKEKAEKS